MCGRLSGLYAPSPLVAFRVYGSVAARCAATPPFGSDILRTGCAGCARSKDRIGIELRAALEDLGLGQHPALHTLWEPQMGANVFSCPQT
jgi:hypothetical protein